MATLTLTSRERVTRALERRDQDRIPRSDNIWPETITRWQSEGLEGGRAEVIEMLRGDFAGVCWSWPLPFPGRHEVIEEDEQTQVIRGPMGKIERSWKHRSGTPEHVSFDCDSRTAWEATYRPALLGGKLSVDPQSAVDQTEHACQAGRWSHLSGIEAFEGMRQLVGDEVVLSAMALDPEWVRDMSRVYTDLILRDFHAVLDAGAKPDGVWVFGDMGYNRGPFFSPDMYRELIWPDHKRIGDFAHANGMKFIYHTDGDVRPLLPDILRAGADAVQPLEAKAGMDVRELAPKYGDRVTFFGNIDMTVAITNDPDKIEAEVTSKLATGMARRGYIYHSDHSVPPQVSWQTYRQLIDLLDAHGTYA